MPPSSTEFGRALIDADTGEVTSTQERLQITFNAPGDSRALTARAVNSITKSQIRYYMSEILHGNLDKINAWLDEVAKDSPAKALELLMQFAEFSTPRLKAVAVQMSDPTAPNGAKRTLSYADLERIAAGEPLNDD